MKKVIIAAFGSHGDILPCLDIGRELKDRGHDVLAIVNPYFSSVTNSAGLDFKTVGTEEEIRALFSNPDSCDNRFFMRAIGGSMQKFIMDAVPVIMGNSDPKNTIILGSSIAVGLKSIAQNLGASLALIHFAPKHFSSVQGVKHFTRPRLPAAALDSSVPTNSSVDRGVDAPLNPEIPVSTGSFGDGVETYEHADVIIGAFPGWYAGSTGSSPPHVAFTDFPLHDDFVDSSLSTEIEDFLAAGPAPVGFTPGTANASAHEFLAKSIEACTRSGRRGILISKHIEHLPDDLPDNILHIEYAPFKALLPRLAAIVHHGGIGTASQAMRAGVPQLIQPLVYDQFDTADRLARLGVALEITSDDYQVERIIEMLDVLQGSATVRAACDSLSRQMAGNGAAQICDFVLRRLGDDLVAA